MHAQSKSNKDHRLENIRAVLERVGRDRKITASFDGSEHEIFPVAISPSEGQALRKWITQEKASQTIEIGLAYGVSALFICEGLLINAAPGARHVVVDPFQEGYKNCGLQVLEEAGVYDLVEHYSEESQILLPKFLSEGRTFDFAFVDGSHLFERVFLDLIYLGRLVQPGRIIFVDDYQLPAIARAVSFCVTNLSWILEEKSPPDDLHQWAVLRIPEKPIQRSFRDFIEF